MNWALRLVEPSDPWDACWTASLGGALHAMVGRTYYEVADGITSVYTEYLVVTDVTEPGNADCSASAHVDVAGIDLRPGEPTAAEWDTHMPQWTVTA